MTAVINAVKNRITAFVAAKTYDVPRATLISKVQVKYRNESSGPDSFPTVDEEKILVGWIKAMGMSGFPITKNQLHDSV